MRDFARGEIFASWWTDAVEEFLSTGAHNFRVRMLSTTTIESPAGPGNDQSSIAINGRLRFNVAAVSRVHPGGPAGAYDVFVTASGQNIVNTPQPNTDNTVYSYALAIVAAGTTPAIVAGSVDIFRKVAEVTWSGAAITAVRQIVPLRSDAPIYPTAPLATFTPERVRGAAGQTAPLTVWEDSAGASLAAMLPGGLADMAGYRVGGVALASTHLSDSPALVRTNQALPAWITPVLTNGWTNYGGGYATCQYRKHVGGHVEVKGVVTGGVAGSQVFLFPPGYRTLTHRAWATTANGLFGALILLSTGSLIDNEGSTLSVSLEPVRFYAEQ